MDSKGKETNKSDQYPDLHVDLAAGPDELKMDSNEGETLDHTCDRYMHVVTPQRLLSASTNTFDRFMKIDRSTKEGVLSGILEISKHFCQDLQVDYDAKVENGVASGLVTLLRRSMFLYEEAKDDDERSRGFRSSGVQYIASLSTALTMILHCSTSTLANRAAEFHKELVPTLMKLAEHFTSNEEADLILLQVILANASRTIHLISPYLQGYTDEFVDTLLLILSGKSTSSPVKASVCDALVDLAKSRGFVRSDEILAKLEANASTVISLLSTSFCLSSGTGRGDLTLRLHDLADLSDSIRAKMMKRRCTLLAIVRHFRHPSLEIRRKGYSFCQVFFDHVDLSSSNLSNGIYENLEVVEAGLTEIALEEKDPGAQLMVASLLHKLVTLQAFPSYALMDALRDLAYTGQSDEVVVECGAAYCEGMEKEPFPSGENLATVVDFTTFPFAQIRSKALQTLESTLTNSESVGDLLDGTEMIENFGLIVTHGSDVDCDAALNIVRQLSRSSRNHARLCKNPDFIATIVNFVTKAEVNNRKSHIYGVEIVLALLSNDENTLSFLPHRHLLPWLVTFLNKTTAEESFKEQVVEVIIRLCTAYLNHD